MEDLIIIKTLKNGSSHSNKYLDNHIKFCRDAKPLTFLIFFLKCSKLNIENLVILQSKI